MRAPTAQILHLRDVEPIAKGRMRLVFRHPSDSLLLIKVIRPDIIDLRWGSGQKWYKKRRRYGQYISYLRESEEYIAGYASSGDSVPFAQKITGFVETDLGLGMVVEAALDENGKLAPTLRKILADNRFDDIVRVELDQFISRILECDIFVADINPANLVRAHTPELGHHFVLIDGLGLSTVLPFKQLSPAFNRMSKRGRIRVLWKKIDRILAQYPKV